MCYLIALSQTIDPAMAVLMQELKELRRAGIRTFADAELYEALRGISSSKPEVLRHLIGIVTYH